jgi:hypothetical protein
MKIQGSWDMTGGDILNIGPYPSLKAALDAQAFQFFKVTGGYEGGGVYGGIKATANGFNTIPLSNVAADYRPDMNIPSGFSYQDNTFTIAENGLYELIGKLRIGDGLGTGKSYGMGVGPANVDNEDFAWFQANTSRNLAQVITSRFCLAGDKIRQYAYLDGFGADVGGMFSVRKIG